MENLNKTGLLPISYKNKTLKTAKVSLFAICGDISMNSIQYEHILQFAANNILNCYKIAIKQRTSHVIRGIYTNTYISHYL